MGTWVTDPATGAQKWQASQYMPSGGPVYAWGDYIDPNNPDLGRYAADVAPQAIQNGLASYDSINIGSDNYFRGNDGYYYKLMPAEGERGNYYDFNTRYTRDNLMGQTMGEWGAIPMTVEPDYNTGSIWDSPLTGAGLFLGGLGAIGALPGIAGAIGDWAGGMLGGAEAAGAGSLADLGYVDTLGGMYGGNVGGAAAATGGTGAGMLQNIPSLTTGTTESLGSLFPSAGGTAYNPATASIADIVSAVSASGGNAIPAGLMTPELAAAAASGASIASVSPSVLSSLTDMIKSATGLDVSPTQLLSGGANILGGLLSGRAGSDAANTYANAQTEAARIAAEAARFKPVGVTTRFGQSKFTKDAQGNVVQAGYDVAPDVAAMRESLMGAAPGMLSQFTGSQATTAPMGTAAQRAMSLGQGYLNTDPLAQAQKYYDDQQAIMATQRARDQAGMLTGEFNRGTYGLATGATGQMGAANPRLEAMYNAQRQQDLALAAAATQGGMDYAKFGAGMVGTGGDLLKSMYGTQSAAYSPFQTAMGGATMLEGLGQNALDMSVNIGKTASPAQAGSLLAQGMLGAAQTQNAASYSPWGTALMGGANAIQGWQNQAAQQQQQQQQNQMLAAALGGRQQATAAPASGSFFAPQQNSMPQEWQWGGIWS